jgi:hypothetical protein
MRVTLSGSSAEPPAFSIAQVQRFAGWFPSDRTVRGMMANGAASTVQPWRDRWLGHCAGAVSADVCRTNATLAGYLVTHFLPRREQDANLSETYVVTLLDWNSMRDLTADKNGGNHHSLLLRT